MDAHFACIIINIVNDIGHSVVRIPKPDSLSDAWKHRGYNFAFYTIANKSILDHELPSKCYGDLITFVKALLDSVHAGDFR